MGQSSIYRVSGMLIVSCLCAEFLPSANESLPSAAQEMNRHLATAKRFTATRATAARSSETRIGRFRHADVSRKLGDYPTAEVIVKELLDSNENSFSSDNVEAAIGLTKLGLLCVDQGKYAEANSYYQRALTIMDKSIGLERSDNSPPPNAQLKAKSAQELYPPSEVVYQRLLAFLTHRMGHEDPTVAVILRDIADLYRREQKFDDAATYYDYALAILRATVGADDPEYGFTDDSYVSMQRERERLPTKDS